MSLVNSPPKSPSSSSSTSLRTYPLKYYNPQLVPTFNSKENENHWFLLSRSVDWLKPVLSSLSPHDETMVSMNIERGVRNIFAQASLDIANVMGLPMYKSLVYEFLASFTVKHGESIFDENSAWEFRIQNTDFRWTRKEASTYLDFPLFGIRPRATLAQRFSIWMKLTGLDHMGTYSSPYSIKCKAWFYVHRLVATNINVRDEALDTVTIDDLNILWALSEGDPVDWFDIFSEHFSRMRDHNSNMSYVGCTSLITFIAKVCGFQFCCHPDEFRELDHAGLKKLRFLTRTIRGTFHPGVIKERSLTDVSEDAEESEKGKKEKPEVGECSKSPGKKRRTEIYVDQLSKEIPWKEVRRVTIYEF